MCCDCKTAPHALSSKVLACCVHILSAATPPFSRHTTFQLPHHLQADTPQAMPPPPTSTRISWQLAISCVDPPAATYGRRAPVRCPPPTTTTRCDR
eukprot:359081-Chlamydomonas_euryale.AAC.4